MSELEKNIQDFISNPAGQMNDREAIDRYATDARDIIHNDPIWQRVIDEGLVHPTMRKIEDESIKNWEVDEEALNNLIDRMFGHQPISTVGQTTQKLMKEHYGRLLRETVEKAIDKQGAQEPNYGHYGLDSYEKRNGFSQVLQSLETKIGQGSRPEILDIGCAVGELLRDLKEKYPTVRTTGVDLFDYIRVAEPDQFIQSTADYLPQNLDGKADVVTSSRVLEYALRTDIAFDSLVKTLAPGGIAYVFICYVRPQVTTEAEVSKFGYLTEEMKEFEDNRYRELISGICEEKGGRYVTDEESQYTARWIEENPVPSDIPKDSLDDFYFTQDFTPTSKPRIDFEKLVRLNLICQFMKLSDSPDFEVECLEPDQIRNDFGYIPPYLIRRKA